MLAAQPGLHAEFCADCCAALHYGGDNPLAPREHFAQAHGDESDVVVLGGIGQLLRRG